MITSITRFQLPRGIPTEAVKKGFLEVAPKFKHPSGLLRKYFLISEDGKTGGGVYLWNSMEEARIFSEGVLRKMIRDKFQAEPSIEYYEAPVVVDNVASEIIAQGDIPTMPNQALERTVDGAKLDFDDFNTETQSAAHPRQRSLSLFSLGRSLENQRFLCLDSSLFFER